MNPYYKTDEIDFYLDIINMPTLPFSIEDELYTIEKKYEFNAPLLANDRYGDTSLWWVFVKRNMDKIEDPVFDFKAGIQIYIPSKRSIEEIN